MKTGMILCATCGDAFSLDEEPAFCKCGASGGYKASSSLSHYWGPCVPFYLHKGVILSLSAVSPSCSSFTRIEGPKPAT